MKWTKEYKKEYNKKWQKNNKERRKQYDKKYRNTHKEKIKEWYQKNKEKELKRVKKWRKDNKQHYYFTKKQRELKKKEIVGSHTQGEWEMLKAQYNWICPSCGKSEPEIKLTEDHIIPISKGGSNNIENIQPLCKNCNCKKYINIKKF